MFFLLPLTHEESAARRLPLVTLALVALNLLVFIGVQRIYEPPREAAAIEAIEALHVQAEQAPYLTPRCHALDVVGRPVPRAERPDDLDDEDLAEAQTRLDALCDDADRALFALPTFRWGDIPARGGVLTLLTSQFLHGGVAHLLFNLWFLWLTACNLEDRWGRLVFPPFYLVAGACGALAHRLLSDHPWLPLIGASGAIAGAMGAFLVLFARTQIRMGYVVWLGFRPRWGTFDAPAWIMLALWLAGELLSALVSRDDGTAHWAHVGGFALGVVGALGMRASRLDQRLDSAVDAKSSVHGDARVLAAAAKLDAGDVAGGTRELAALCQAEPANIDARLELRRAARSAADGGLLARTTLELVGLYLEQGAVETSAELLIELRREGVAELVPRDRLLRLGERFAQRGHAELALSCFASVHGGAIRDELGLRAAVAHGAVALKSGNLADARRLFEAAAASPSLTPELASKLEAQRAALARAGG